MKIEKIQVISQPRKLKDKWTIEYDSPESEVGDSFIDEIEKILAAEQEWKVQSTMLVNSGWKKVDVDFSYPFAVEAPGWAAKNCQGKFTNRGATFLFENEQDATAFLLRWS